MVNRLKHPAGHVFKFAQESKLHLIMGATVRLNVYRLMVKAG